MPKERPGVLPGPLPLLYARWMGELLAAPIPPEGEATCDDCAMCPGTGEARSDTHFFNPDTKCCTYIPDLPNFLAGGILAEQDPQMAAGRATVEARLKVAVGVTPLGLGCPSVHRLVYDHGGSATFGRARTLRCPHYLEEGGGRCGIWRHRPAVCATWFCKHARGAVGARFWRALLHLLGTIEGNLARWCVLELGLSAEALRRLFPEGEDPRRPVPLDADAVDGRADPATSRALWGNWWGRERELYEASARLVRGMAWAHVVAIGGAPARLFARLAAEAFRALASEELPDRLLVASCQAAPMGHGITRVVSYSPYDPLALPKALMDLLPYFDGRPTREALRRIQKETGITLERRLVRRLADFEILLPPPDPPTAPT